MAPSSLSKSANQFAIELFQCYLNRHGDKYKNLLLCPYVIYHSLAMMLVGAKGTTAEQLQKLLKIPSASCQQSRSRSKSPTASKSPGGRMSNCGSDLKLNSSSVDGLNALKSSTMSYHGTRSPVRTAIRCSRKDKQPAKKVSPGSTASSSDRSNPSVSERERSLTSPRSLTPDGVDENRHKEFLMLTEQLIHGNHDFVHLASFIYLDKETKRTERFKAILRDYYETKPKKIDFDNVDLMVKTVNEDVKRTTENIYNEILTKQEAQKLEKTYMLLVNAVFFRGFWLSNFTDVKKGLFVKFSSPESMPTPGTQQEQATKQISPVSGGKAETLKSREASQKTPQNQSYEVNMMSKLDYLPVLVEDSLDARIIKMPFEASDLQMLIILPNNRQSDAKYLCDKISALKINQVLQQFSAAKSRTVRVSMPIFCIDSGKISIQSTLVTMGASDLFDKLKANMSGVCENKQIWLHKILHRCFIICDNRGAITSSNFEKAKRRNAKIENGISTGRSGVDEFVADHPFMYIIIDSVTRTILLIGLYTDPSETIEIIHENQLSPEEADQIYTEGVYKT